MRDHRCRRLGRLLSGLAFGLSAAVLLQVAPCRAEGRPDHLEPFVDVLLRITDQDDYYRRVFSLLHRGFDLHSAARYTVIPSFVPEYAWALERRPEGPRLHVVRLSASCWYTEYASQHVFALDVDTMTPVTRPQVVKRPVEAASEFIPLEPDLADAVEELFRTAVAGTASVQQDWYGCDGSNYYFTGPDANGLPQTGQIWSPRDDSRMGRLVALCKELHALPAGDAGAQRRLTERARLLIEELRP